MDKDRGTKANRKSEQLEAFRKQSQGKVMTTNQGVKVNDDENTLKAGKRGPTLFEDFHFREKLAHFDRERIPERVVHARGYGVHGDFQVYQCMKEWTKASFLQDPSVKTPVFVRFSEVSGSKGAYETNRDVRGFAVKFYTDEGVFDLVGNNIPIFFIQDSIKFPDLIHALKPEPHNEIPQGQSAHDTFWDFIANNQESAAMMMWLMSDRTVPRSFRMMEGFGVHTFRMVNEAGVSRFVKFHWKPVLGVHSLLFKEAQQIGGYDPDFHRRDLWSNIEMGNYAEFELGVQMIPEEDEMMFGFDILDSTKLWPEEDVPVTIIGKMTLNRNVDNVFAETEQVALHPGNIVPGIDFTSDPLLQGRLFSYTDTQLYRVGTNYKELPINRPLCPFHNNQRDGAARISIDLGQVAYHNNSLANNTPVTVSGEDGGFVSYPEQLGGTKTRETGELFSDHFSQARLFWNSMSDIEKMHITEAFSFELGKVKSLSVREQVVDMIARISTSLAESVARNIGVEVPCECKQIEVSKSSPALSQANTVFLPYTLRVGVIVAEGFDGQMLGAVLAYFKKYGLQPVILSKQLGRITGNNGMELDVDDSFITGAPVLYDSLYVIGGEGQCPYFVGKAQEFVRESFKHYKPIGASGPGIGIIQSLGIEQEDGVIIGQGAAEFAGRFIPAAAQRRFFGRSIM
ncbi:catalase [Bacillus testis]|uniref:catalase n=1 Tax=Bacillus testis TaxID=1622072 RepID=UPI00067EF897|nr:catalase [Bacillus testis]